MSRETFMGYPLDDSDYARLMAKVDDGAEGCWEWLASKDRLGYGHFRVGGRYGSVASAHRVVAFFCLPDFIESLHVMHSCDNRACCNPAHLSMGTHKENMEDRNAKGRNRTPRPGNGHAKVSKQSRAELVKLHESGEGFSALGRRYGISPTRARQIYKEDCL